MLSKKKFGGITVAGVRQKEQKSSRSQKGTFWHAALKLPDVKERYAELKQNSADRCPRLLGTEVKIPEVQFHHNVYNQKLWNRF